MTPDRAVVSILNRSITLNVDDATLAERRRYSGLEVGQSRSPRVQRAARLGSMAQSADKSAARKFD